MLSYGGAALLAHPVLGNATKAATNAIYGVDLVNTTLFGQGVPAITDDHIDILVAEQVPIVVFFWDTPPKAWVDRLHAAGSRVWMQVGSKQGALDAVAVGVDLLIAQGIEAGGHKRGLHEGVIIPRARLVAECNAIPGSRIVLSAGGIANGIGLAQALREGGEGAWVGTRFASSVESYAHDEYKRRVVATLTPANAVDVTMFGPEWPGANIEVLRDRVVDQWAGRESQIPSPPPPPAIIGHTIFGGAPYDMPKFSVILPTRDTTGDFEEMCWAAGGISSSQIDSVKPAAQIIQEMSLEARALLALDCRCEG